MYYRERIERKLRRCNLPGARVEKFPVPNEHIHDVSAWCDADVSKLNSKARKRFGKRKAAVITYLTTTEPIEEVAQRYSLPVPLLQRWADKCLMLHADGQPWGFRALIPGVTVVDHTPATPVEDAIPSITDEPVSGETIAHEASSTETLPEQSSQSSQNRTNLSLRRSLPRQIQILR